MFIPCSNKIGNCFALEIVVKGTVSQNKVWRFIICDVYRAGGSDDISLCVGVMFCSLGLVGLMANLASIFTLLSPDMRKHTFNQLLAALAFYDIL